MMNIVETELSDRLTMPIMEDTDVINQSGSADETVRTPVTGKPWHHGFTIEDALDRTRQLMNEPDNCYDAFCLYRNKGKWRSIANTAAETGYSDATIRRWAQKWNWKQRVRIFNHFSTGNNGSTTGCEVNPDQNCDTYKEARETMSYLIQIIKKHIMEEPEEIFALNTLELIRLVNEIIKMMKMTE
jgi:hypothetical protein